MDDVSIARALHVLAVVHWIGGVALVTAVILPAIARISEPARRIAMFEEIEGRFSRQVKVSVTIAGLSGFYITHRLEAWDRFADPQFWWMYAMAAVWAVFTFVLFIGEPLFLNAWFIRRAKREPESTFAVIHRAHWVLLGMSTIAVAGGILGAHGAFY